MHKKDEKKKTDLQSDFQLKAVQILILLQIYISTSSVTSDGPTLFAVCYKKSKTSYFVCLFFFVCNIKVSYHLFNTGVVSKFKSLVCWKSCKEVKLSNNTQKANIRKKTNILINVIFFSSKFAIFTNHKIVDIMFVIEHSFRYNFIAFCRCVKKMWRY